MGEADEMTSAAILSRPAAEEFLYKEARLIDEDRLEEWLTLFTQDGIYWIPSDETTDPEIETSIIHDDVLQLEKRIYQLRNKHLAQDPRSRTIHLINNVEVEAGGSSTESVIRCNTIIYEMRPGDHQQLQSGLAEQRAFVARCLYKLRQQGGNWRISHKRINLINRDLPLENITFIL
jgi:3-phenylpropionate/cinnamic acid dioxygenase small subunit